MGMRIKTARTIAGFIRSVIAEIARTANLAWLLFSTEKTLDSWQRVWRYYDYLRRTRIEGEDDAEAVANATAKRGFILWLQTAGKREFPDKVFPRK